MVLSLSVKRGGGGGVALSSRRTWPRWAAPPCRPTSASSPARPAPGRLWSVTEERKLGSNNNNKKHGASASVTGLDLVKQRPRIYVLMRTSHERKRKELHHSLCLWQHAEIFCVLAFRRFILRAHFLYVWHLSSRVQTLFRQALSPPLLLCALIWCLPCQDESVSEWHRHTWQRPFNMNIKQERTLRHAPRFHHLRYRSLEPNAATPSLRRQLRLLVDQVYKNYSRLERSIWLNHWLLTQNDKLTRLMQ